MSECIKKKNLSRGIFKCYLCDKFFKRKSTLIEHSIDVHSSDKKIKCTIDGCNYKTNRTGNYNLHLRTKHKIYLPLKKCYSKNCRKISRNESYLIKHMRRCLGKPIFASRICTVKNCKEEFLTKKGLETHLKIKHNFPIEIGNREDIEIGNREDIEIFHNEIEELLIL